MITANLIIWIFVFAMLIFFAYRLFIYRSIGHALKGSLKAVYFVFFALCIWILLPPYGVDIETLIAIPLSGYLITMMDMSIGWAIGLSYVLIFGFALAFVLMHFFLFRHYVKQL